MVVELKIDKLFVAVVSHARGDSHLLLFLCPSFDIKVRLTYCAYHVELVRFGPDVGQIGPKWDNSGTFSDQISVHFGFQSRNCPI